MRDLCILHVFSILATIFLFVGNNTNLFKNKQVLNYT